MITHRKVLMADRRNGFEPPQFTPSWDQTPRSAHTAPPAGYPVPPPPNENRSEPFPRDTGYAPPTYGGGPAPPFRQAGPRHGAPSHSVGGGLTGEGRPSDGRAYDGRPYDGRAYDGRPYDGRPYDGRPSDGRAYDGRPGDQRRDGRPGDGRSTDARPDRLDDQVPRRTGRQDKNPWHWLLLIPIVVPLMPIIYNRIEPTLFGVPFFYWGQLAFAFLASIVIAIVNMMDR